MRLVKRVRPVFSVHNPKRADPRELAWLLSKLKPDVLFLEHPSDNLASFRDGSVGSLESLAVSAYGRTHATELVAVDVPHSEYELPPVELKKRFDYMFEMVEAVSSRFRSLHEAHGVDTERGGFAYLHSPLAWERERAIVHETRSAVESVNNRKLSEHFDLWTRFNSKRENAMLAAIEKFAAGSAFAAGVFIVGSAHRQPLRDLTQGSDHENAVVTWEFDWELPSAASN